MKRIAGTVIFVLLVPLCVQSQDACKLKIDKDSIKVYTCHTDTSRFKSLVTELTVNSTLDQLARFVLDIPNYTRWQYNTIESKSIRKISDSEQIYRTVIEAPWPVTNRDMVVHLRLIYSEDKKNLVITADSQVGIVPYKEGLVRVPSSHAQWTVSREGKKLRIRYMMQIDPGGAVPAWLANWVCAHAPYLSFRQLKAELEK